MALVKALLSFMISLIRLASPMDRKLFSDKKQLHYPFGRYWDIRHYVVWYL